MFGTMKKAMIAGAIVAAGALAGPALASAAAWDVDGTPVGGAPGIAVEGSGTFSFSANVGVPLTFRCDVATEADLWNAAGVGAGSLTSFDIDPASCVVVGVPNCAIYPVTPTMPWAISTAGSAVTINGASFTFRLVNAGGTCVLAGTRLVTGSVTGTWLEPGSWEPGAPGILESTNALGLTIVGLGPVAVNSFIGMVPVGGGDLYLR